MKRVPKPAVKPMEKRRSYSELHWADKSLDIALLAGVVVGILLMAVELFAPPQVELGGVIIAVDVILIGIFIADSGRAFFKCRNLSQYFKTHWIDLVVLLVVLLSLSSVILVGFGRLRWLIRGERMIGGTGRFLSVAYIRRMFK